MGAALIAIDWGTSSLRAYLMSAEGAILDRRDGSEGVMNVAQGDFAGTLARRLADWPVQSLPVVMCGMVGSRQGWREVPYLDCPAAPADLGRMLSALELPHGGRGWILPGLRCRDDAGVPDVMRGEEAQVLGALAHDEGKGGDADFCLPGTHGKHVRLEGGRILSFTSHMTGEVFALLTRHGILGRLMAQDAAPDDDPFLAGVHRSGDPGGLLHQIFGARSLPLAGELPEAAIGDYLSGILIGAELRATAWRGEVGIIARRQLAARYHLALEALGIRARLHADDLAAHGLWLVARQAGILA